MRRPLLHALPLLILAIGFVGCFDLNRASNLEAGTVVGTALRPDVDGRPGAAFVKVSGIGTNLVRVGDPRGAFVVGGLRGGRLDLRLVDDVDGDGWADRGREVSMFFPADGGAVAGIDLGELDLAGTFGLRGEAFVDDGVEHVVEAGQVARIYAIRGRCSDVDTGAGFDLGEGACAAGAAARIEHGVEGEAAADNVGAWQLTRLIAGPVDIVGVLYEHNADGSLGAVLDVVGPIGVPGTATDEVPQDGGPRLVFDGVPPAPVDVDLVLSAPVGDDAFAIIAARGTPIVACDAARAAAQGVILPISAGITTVRASAVAAGVYDVVVCDGDLRGTANGQLALPNETALRWPVVLLAGDACPSDPTDPGDATRDCDADGRRGLPLSTIDDLRADCAIQCVSDSTSLGAAIGERTCTVADAVYDCDDDSDGQPDVTEPVACIGPGRGTDLDGDGLCSINDAFPHCAANTAAACSAGDEDITPRVPAAVGGLGTVTSLEFAAVDGGGAIVTVPSSVTGEPTRFAILGIVDDDAAPSETLPFLTLDADGNLDASGVTTWSEASGAGGISPAITPRLDFAVVGNVIVGGSARECASSDTPCTTFVEHIFADQFSMSSGTLPPVTFQGSGGPGLRVPRVGAGAASGSGNLYVAGGLTCPEDTLPESDGSVVCASADRVIAGTIEALLSPNPPQVLTTVRHGASVEVFYDDSIFVEYVFVIGGDTAEPGATRPIPTNAVEVFSVDDSATFSPPAITVKDLAVARVQHATTRVQAGAGDVTIVVSGGVDDGDGERARSFEVWRPGQENWSIGRLLTPRAQHASVPLPDGRVLLIGGINPKTGATLATTEIIDPRPRTAELPTGVRGAALSAARRRPLASVIDDGRILILGGFDGEALVAGVDIFDVRRTVDSNFGPIDVDLDGCSDAAIADDGTTVALRCELPEALGYQDDDDGDDLLVVNMVSGSITCVTCRGGRGGALAGDEISISSDGRRLAFATTTSLDIDDENTDPDLSAFERVDSFGVASLRSRGDTFLALGIDLAAGFSVQLDVERFGFFGSGAAVFKAKDSEDVFVGGYLASPRPTFGGAVRVSVGGDSSARILVAYDDSLSFGTDPEAENEIVETVAGVTKASVISPDGRSIAWFSVDPFDDVDVDGVYDLLRATVDEQGEVRIENLTADTAVDACGAGGNCSAISVANGGRVAWINGARAVVSDAVDQIVTRVELADFDAIGVRLSPSGQWATVSTAAPVDGHRVFRVNVNARTTAP